MYWKPQPQGVPTGNPKQLQGVNSSLPALALSDQILNLPKIGDKILLQIAPWGNISVFDTEASSPLPHASYVEVEVVAIKKAVISYE